MAPEQIRRPRPGAEPARALPGGEPGSVRRLRRVGEACLWLLLAGAVVLGAMQLAAVLRLAVLPILLALVLATILLPPTRWLRDRGWPSGLAAITVLGLSVLLFFGTLAALTPSIVAQVAEVDLEVTAMAEWARTQVVESPLPISGEQIGAGIEGLQQEVRMSVAAIAAEIVGGALLAVELVTGALLALVILFFYLKDGERMWAFLVSLAPPERRHDVDEMGDRAWVALGGFIRGQTFVALFDAVLIGIGLVIIGVPLALPLALLTFFGGYIPVVGATVAGVVAVLVALATEGVFAAGATIGLVLLVQQVEGNLLQPLVVGRAVAVHPLAILLGVTAGGVLAGVIGMMVAAPLVAVAGAILGYLLERASGASPEETRDTREAVAARPTPASVAQE